MRAENSAPRGRFFALGMTGPALWLTLLAFALYLPPALTVLQLDPDAIEYIDVARHLAAGRGFLLGIKSYHIGGTEVLHDGLNERAPLYPLTIAALLRFGLDVPMLQIFNAFMAALCVALVYGIGKTWFGERTGLLAGLLAAASPVMLINMLPPMTEALTVFLILLAVWLVARDNCEGRIQSYIAAGAALGLGYLARPTTMPLAGVLLIGTAFTRHARQAWLRPVFGLLLGMAIFVLPTVLYSIATRGSPFYSGQTYLYSVFDDDDVIRHATGRPLPSPAEFMLANREFVASAIIKNMRAYGSMLFLDSKWLLFLLPAWPMLLLALARGRYPPAARLVLLLAATNFLIYALTWANYQRRYQLLTLLLLLPFAVDGLCRLGLARLKLPVLPKVTALHLGVLVVVLSWSATLVGEYRGTFRYGDVPVGTRSYLGVRFTGPPAWIEDKDLTQALDWVASHTEPHEVLTHAQPGIFTFFTQRPTARLPRRLDPEGLKSFLADYRVAYVLLNNYDGYRRRYQDELQALQPQGVQMTALEDYRIFDTRALWR